jgi:gliding motility-associated-like protein
MMRSVRLFFLLIIFSGAAFGQQLSEPPQCGADAFTQLLRKDPMFVVRENDLNEKIRTRVLQTTNQRNLKNTGYNSSNKTAKNVVKSLSVPVVTIPVVFHIVNQNPASITDQMIVDAVAELNAAFAHAGIYGSDTAGADTRIQFCLASKAPDGGKTNGIDRINSYYENIDIDLESAKLGALSTWDVTKYANIWLVNSIQGEILPSAFECGKWDRMGYGGYAGAGTGLVVSGLSAPLVAHEMGHYLSLLHTFQGVNCLNNDCTQDGDKVCDTPPDRTMKGSPCSSPDNSCNTDTISGPFTKNVPDNIANFMDYGSPCPSMFTQGQADRMMAFLTVFNSGSLLLSDGCVPPCTDNLKADFNFDGNPHPIAGSSVDFINTSVGATKYEWFLNGTMVATTNNYSNTFINVGSYTVVLKAYNATADCYSSYSATVVVNCGVDARFSPDKRMIASAGGVYKDAVLFSNKSYGATTYDWYVTDEMGINEQVVSTQTDLLYDFLKPGSYQIWLVASAGACIEKSPTYTLQVQDPAADGQINIYEVNCYKNDSIRVVFAVRNNGFDTIPAGISVNFYDRYPGVSGSIKMLHSFVTDQYILGKCEKVYTHIIKSPRRGLDSITLVFDEELLVNELNEGNNKSARKGFKSNLSLSITDTTVWVNSSLVIKNLTTPDWPKSITWSASIGSFSCTSCSNPTFYVIDTARIKLYTMSNWGCEDSAFATINVFPVDLSIANKYVSCYKNDSIQINSIVYLDNHYTSLYKRTSIRYFDGDSTLPTSNYLGTSWIETSQPFVNNEALIKHTVLNQNITSVFAYLNPGLTPLENNLSNNSVSKPFTPFSIRINPAQIDVYRSEPIKLLPINNGDSATSIVWTPPNGLSCANCLTPNLTPNADVLLKIVGSTPLFCIDSATLQVYAYYRSLIALPNAFTPNGDGLNDVFYVIAGKEVATVKLFQIFNRWGQKVFEKSNSKANDRGVGWDGSYNGRLVEQGTYVYQIVIELTTGEQKIYKGNISILR